MFLNVTLIQSMLFRHFEKAPTVVKSRLGICNEFINTFQVPSNPDNTSEKPSSALQASDVRNTGGHSSGASDRERDREARGGGGSTASTNHVGANEKERERGQNGEIDYRKVKLAVIAFKANLAIFCILQLWEQSQIDNSRLRDELSKTRDELSAAKKKIETVVQVIYSF